MVNIRRIVLGLILFFTLCMLNSENGSSQASPAIIILSPGQGSVVTSPIHFSAALVPGEDDLVRVTLIDQNGQLLVRQLSRWAPQADPQAPFTTELVYEIPNESAQGLITVETQDKHHRPMTLRGVLLTLQNSGQTQLQASSEQEPWINIISPQPYEFFSSGKFAIKGTAKPITTKPIIFELITETGGVIGSKQLAVDNPGESMSFEVPLSYSFITSTREVRLVMRQTVDPYGENIVLDSLPLFITP
ncbi:MAG: hypothetical protein ACK2TV_05885 [Anaerolineales bacterium]